MSFLAGLPCLQVVVEGQANAVPIRSVAAPVISNATFATAGVTVASTTGGTLLATAVPVPPPTLPTNLSHDYTVVGDHRSQ